MATRRLVEGTVRYVRTPAQPRTITRRLQIIEPPTITKTVVTNGVREVVSSGIDLTRAKRGLQPGMIVFVRNSRRANVPYGVFTPDSVAPLYPDPTDYRRVQYATAHLATENSSGLYMISAVAQGGQFFLGRRILPSLYTTVAPSGDITYHRRFMSHMPTEAELGIRAGNTMAIAATPMDLNHSVLKAGAVTRVYRWEDFPAEYRAFVRSYSRRHVLSDLKKKLSRAERNFAVASNYNTQRTRHRDVFKSIGARIATLLATAEIAVRTRDGSMIDSVMRNIAEQVCEVPRTASIDYTTGVDKIVRPFLEKRGLEVPTRGGCDHWAFELFPVLRRNGSPIEHYCAACSLNYGVDAVDADGNNVRVHRDYVRVYQWEDGIVRTIPEPRIINGYHQSKKIVGFVEPLVSVGKQYPTLGFELEVQGATYDIRENTSRLENLAREFRDRLKLSPLPAKFHQKYLSFEYDGSVSGGFEAVSGWTDLQTHRKLISALLLDERGKSPWTGKLKSHSAEDACCGLHVHITKPKSLLHAAKIKYLMNSPQFKKILKDVARRYGNDYARINGVTSANALASDQLKQHKVGAGLVKVLGYDYRTGRNTTAPVPMSMHNKIIALKEASKNAINQMSSIRYEIANFTNPATVEIRAFRGSLMYRTVMACMEFVQAMWYFCRDVSATSITPENFLAFISAPERGRDTRELRSYLAAKGHPVRIGKPDTRKPPLVGPVVPELADAEAA